MDQATAKRAYAILSRFYRRLVDEAAEAVIENEDLLTGGGFMAGELCEQHAMMLQRVGMLLNSLRDMEEGQPPAKLKVETIRCRQDEISPRIEKLLKEQGEPTRIAHTSVERITDEDYMVIVVLRHGQEEG